MSKENPMVVNPSSNEQVLLEARERINAIDNVLVAKLNERLAVVETIHAYKVEHGLPTLDVARERSLLARITAASEPQWAPYVRAQFEGIMLASRHYQNREASSTDEGLKAGDYELTLSCPDEQSYLFSVLSTYGVTLESMTITPLNAGTRVGLRPQRNTAEQKRAWGALLKECRDHGLVFRPLTQKEA